MALRLLLIVVICVMLSIMILEKDLLYKHLCYQALRIGLMPMHGVTILNIPMSEQLKLLQLTLQSLKKLPMR